MDVLNGYRDSHDISSDDDSDDSDKECTVWKRATTKRTCEDSILPKIEEDELKKEEPAPAPAQPAAKRKRNTIWSEVLQDQLISEDLEDCLLKNKPRNYGCRGKESYDYTLKYSDPRSEKDSDSVMSDNSGMSDESSKSKVKHSSSARNNCKKFVKLDSAEFAVARKINKVLNEKKFYLIQRIVKNVGIEKSMALLAMTEEIEDNGGMMINNNTRRRTPGGVYIQLLKTDKEVTKEMLDKIFEGEMSALELKKYYAEKKMNRKKNPRKRRNHKQQSNGCKEMAENGKEMGESAEIIPMEAEVTVDDKNCEQTSIVPVNPLPVPVFSKNASENGSDLEEGEIED